MLPVGSDEDWERLARMFDQAPSFMVLLREPEHRIHLANKAALRLFENAEIVGQTVAEILPARLAADVLPVLDQCYRNGQRLRFSAAKLPLRDGEAAHERLLDLVLQPVTGRDGAVTGIFIEGSDVTERVRAEQRLRGSLATETVGIAYWGADATLTEVNDAFLRMTGFSRAEAIGLTWQQLTPKEFWPVSEQAIRQLSVRGEAAPYEKQYFRKDGSRWWGLFAPRRITADEVVEFVLDITERMEAEEALRDREQRLQLIVDSATDYAILTLDTERRVTSWSPGAAKAFGYRDEEIVGRLVDVLFTIDDRRAGMPAQEAERARAEGSAPDVRWHLHKDGHQVFVRGSSHLLRGASGEELGFLKIGRDETERRRAELALRETEERYRLAVRATKDAVWDWDLAADRILWNEAVQVLFGYGPGDIEPSPGWWKSKIHPEDRERVLRELDQVIASGGVDWAAEYRFRRKDGRFAEILDRGTALRKDDGTAFRMVGAMHDLTPHKEAEAALRQLNETLERRVLEEVSARLKTENALRQSQKLEAIGQLTGGVAHDFNNLLTVIRGAAELLRRGGLAEDKRARYIEAIADTADRAAKLTGQLLAFSRRQALKPEVFNAQLRLEAIREMLTTVIGPQVSLVADIDCETCYIEVDPSQFETALINMAVNARDAMDGVGELRITIEPTDCVPAVRGHAATRGEFVAVRIADTGSGIEADKLTQIFEPFFTTKEVGKGTGLGLSQVYGFAKQSGGEVSVRSEIGRGTTFTLYLPRVNAKSEDHPPAREISDEGISRGHILVVEDNEQVGAFATQLLSELGFTTSWAPSADLALQRIAAAPDRYAAVFSDVVMPGMSGVELGREIRRHQPDLPVILTSGYSQAIAQDGSHGFELLQKPYSIEELTRVLRRAIAGSRRSNR
jgi:PAS domain S-box-containing protein